MSHVQLKFLIEYGKLTVENKVRLKPTNAMKLTRCQTDRHVEAPPNAYHVAAVELQSVDK